MKLVPKQVEIIAKYLIIFALLAWVLWYVIKIPIAIPLTINTFQVYIYLDLKFFNVFVDGTKRT